jgi:hypothetical protein
VDVLQHEHRRRPAVEVAQERQSDLVWMPAALEQCGQHADTSRH